MTSWNTVKDFRDLVVRERKVIVPKEKPKKVPRYGNAKWRALAD